VPRTTFSSVICRREFFEGGKAPIAAVLFPGHDGGSRGSVEHKTCSTRAARWHGRNRRATVERRLSHGVDCRCRSRVVLCYRKWPLTLEHFPEAQGWDPTVCPAKDEGQPRHSSRRIVWPAACGDVMQEREAAYSMTERTDPAFWSKQWL
jgi:hypothetical protein